MEWTCNKLLHVFGVGRVGQGELRGGGAGESITAAAIIAAPREPRGPQPWRGEGPPSASLRRLHPAGANP